MAEEVIQGEVHKRRGKKRKSFMQNAKSFARKGNFGEISTKFY